MLNADKEMENELREAYLGGCPRMPFSQTLRYAKKNYPRNINHMPAVIFFAGLDFGKNCCSRTAS